MSENSLALEQLGQCLSDIERLAIKSKLREHVQTYRCKIQIVSAISCLNPSLATEQLARLDLSSLLDSLQQISRQTQQKTNVLIIFLRISKLRNY